MGGSKSLLILGIGEESRIETKLAAKSPPIKAGRTSHIEEKRRRLVQQNLRSFLRNKGFGEVFLLFFEVDFMLADDNLGGGVVEAEFAGGFADAQFILEDFVQQVFSFLSEFGVTYSSILW